MSETSSFKLNVNDESFKQRQKDVFDQLGVLEKQNKINQMEVDTSTTDNRLIEASRPRSDNKRSHTYTRQFRGKESIFKKPQNPSAKNFLRRIPDFKKNPHKWTKYSLEDVRDEDMSEKSNTQAALSFLKEIKERKNQEMKMEGDSTDTPAKITFRKVIRVEPEKTSGTSEEMSDDKASFNSSKIVMPEYVVGQKLKKEKVKKEKLGKGKELKLDHLFEDEDS